MGKLRERRVTSLSREGIVSRSASLRPSPLAPQGGAGKRFATRVRHLASASRPLSCVRAFVKGVTEALTCAGFILTTSEYNKATLAEHMASGTLDPLPVHLVPLGNELSLSAPIESEISSVVAGIIDTDYVLCVGTIEVRKNPTYLFNI